MTSNLVQVKTVDPLAVAPKEAGRILGVSRNHVYDLVNAGHLDVARSGGRILIDYQSLLAYYDRIRAASS